MTLIGIMYRHVVGSCSIHSLLLVFFHRASHIILPCLTDPD